MNEAEFAAYDHLQFWQVYWFTNREPTMVRETHEEVKHSEQAKINLLAANTAGRTAENNNLASVAFKELSRVPY